MTAVDASRASTAGAVPHDPRVERDLLGVCMLPDGPVGAAARIVGPEHFYVPSHAATFEGILALHARGEPAEPVLVAHQAPGGLPVGDLLRLVTDAPSRGTAGPLATLVVEMATRRAALAAAGELNLAASSAPDLAAALAQQVAALDALLRASTPVEPPPSLGRFLAEAPTEADWALPGLLERGERLIVTGGEGTGKSTLCRQVAVTAAAGLHPFSFEPVEPVRVLLVDAENPATLVRRRLGELRSRLPGSSPVDGHLHIHIAGELDLLDAQAAAAFAALVAEVEPELLVVGPIYRMAGGDPNEDGHAAAVQAVLDRIRQRHRCALLAEAHTPHGDAERPFGSSRWKRWPEFGLFLAADGALRHWRGPRDERSWPDSLARGGTWPWTPVEVHRDAEPWSGPTHCSAAILELLEANRGEEMSVNTIQTRLRVGGKSYRKETVSVAAETLVVQGRVAVRSGPRGSRLYRSEA